MSVYYIGSYDVTDVELYNRYVQQVVPLLMKYGAEILVAAREVRPIEGTPKNVNLVMRFPTEADAMDWYNDPDYQGVKAMRIQSTKNSTGIFASQFSPASP